MANEKGTNQLPILYGIIGFLGGALIAVLLVRSAVNNNMGDMMRIMGIRQANDQRVEMMGDMMGHGMTMEDMAQELRGKTGDEFDRNFISLMIEHHQGAIDMANLAKQNAEHQEIKDLADDIISAQTKEIELMRQWQMSWGY